jgi:hypothetical protein
VQPVNMPLKNDRGGEALGSEAEDLFAEIIQV